MNVNKRGYIGFSPISNFMQQFDKVLRQTDFTPGYIDTDHSNNVVSVYGLSDSFEALDEGQAVQYYTVWITDHQNGEYDVEFKLPEKPNYANAH